jgi:taurine dioxygenase/putative 2-oxoglutarate oxygenase
MSADIRFTPLSRAIGARVTGVDLGRPLLAADYEKVHAAWMRFGILLFCGQAMTPEQQVTFARAFGELLVYTRSENAHPTFPELLVLSNVVENGKPIGAAISARYWHTDGHFLDAPPAGSLLYGQEVPPEGGDTCFASMTAAYDALSARMRARIHGLGIVIDRVQTLRYHYPDRPAPPSNQKDAWPDKVQPLVRTHPVTGRKALYLGGIVPWRIEGWPVTRSEPLMKALQRVALNTRFQYRHRWRPGDAILWDNRCVIHRATDYDMTRFRRMMVRAAIAGDAAY